MISNYRKGDIVTRQDPAKAETGNLHHSLHQNTLHLAPLIHHNFKYPQTYMMHMQRIYAQLEDLTYQKIEVYIKENDISRAKFLVDAINAYLHLLEYGNDANPEVLHQEIMQLRTKESESWQEITKLKSTIKDANSTIAALQDRNTKLQENTTQSTQDLTSLKEELILSKAEVDKWKEALRIKDGDIDYLRSHVSQLTQSISQLALPPSQEEAKTKGWWKFWRKA